MKVLIAGDFCPNGRLKELIESRQFESVLGEVKPIVETADYAIVNYESPVAADDNKPIVKQGPHLKSTSEGVEAIKWAGFRCLTLANNHFYDYGEVGAHKTIEACRNLNLDYVGAGENIERASRTLYINGPTKTLALINCCEHEFSIATKDKAGSNPLEPIRQYYAILEAKKKADFVLVIVHGGFEHFQLPTPRMQATYRFFVDAGADAVVNHHQHCYSGYEVYQGKPIFYGLGNFCFDSISNTTPLWEVGFIVVIHFEDIISFQIIPYKQCSDVPAVTLLSNRDKFDKSIREINSIILSHERLNAAVSTYYAESVKSSKAGLEPFYGTKLGKSLGRIRSTFINNKQVVKLYDSIFCESHRDKMMFFLNEKIKELK